MIYYLHAKGSCCQHQSKNVAFENLSKSLRRKLQATKKMDRLALQDSVALWREYMNTFNIEFPSMCMEKVGIDKYSTCGVEGMECHYEGNYFWSDCEHIAQLPIMYDPFRWPESEQFIGRIIYTRGEYCESIFKESAYSLYSFAKNLYYHRLSRVDFLSDLYQRVMSIGKEYSESFLTATTPSLNVTKSNIKLFHHNETIHTSSFYPQFCSDIRTPQRYKSLLQQLPQDVLTDTISRIHLPTDFNIHSNAEKDQKQLLIRQVYLFLRPMIEYFVAHSAS